MHYHHGPSSAADEVLPSSPPTLPAMSSSPASSMLLSPTRSSRRKERRNPSVTPRRFGRFFTPRSSFTSMAMSRHSRKILGTLDDTDMNHRLLASPQSLMLRAHDDDNDHHHHLLLSSDPMGPPSPSEGRSRAANDGNGNSNSNSNSNDHDNDDSNGNDKSDRDGSDDHGTGRGKRRFTNARETPPKRRRAGPSAEDMEREMPPPPLNLVPRSPPSIQISNQDRPRTATATDNAAESLCEQRKATLNLFFKVSRNGAKERGTKSTPASASQGNASVGPKILEGYDPQPIRKFRGFGGASHLLDREHGFSSYPDSGRLARPALDPRIETSAFYSRSIDTHTCTTHSGSGNTIPFSMASCHRSSVTAIGDEQGFVRLFNTSMTSNVTESKVDVFVPVHDNAIMDLAFSDDDLRLASAAGDRTARIVDVATQTVAVELSGGHCDSLRQVSFQPGQANGSVLATSDKAGRVQLWDLRCSPLPIHAFSTVDKAAAGSGIRSGIRSRDTSLDPFPAKPINTIYNAHQRGQQSVSAASVTSIHWMPAGREHLLLSGSEANASIKLWDTRVIKPRRQLAESLPLALTPEPQSHGWRSYGIASMALSGDASRLYALCRDSSVYAYSTAHLMLGHAPELVDGATKRKPNSVIGLGPLYAFKHPSFRAQSFYVKCAMRPSLDGSSEILAVGSSDGCAVLFPTDERYLHSRFLSSSSSSTSTSTYTSATSTSTSTTTSFSQQPANPSSSFSSIGGSLSSSSFSSSLPISKAGTPLIRGHTREVTTLAWTHDGKLVTASDDYIIRQWQQGESQARHLRQVGEFGGDRYMAGWADVGDDWDDCI